MLPRVNKYTPHKGETPFLFTFVISPSLFLSSKALLRSIFNVPLAHPPSRFFPSPPRETRATSSHSVIFSLAATSVPPQIPIHWPQLPDSRHTSSPLHPSTCGNRTDSSLDAPTSIPSIPWAGCSRRDADDLIVVTQRLQLCSPCPPVPPALCTAFLTMVSDHSFFA